LGMVMEHLSNNGYIQLELELELNLCHRMLQLPILIKIIKLTLLLL